MPLFSWEKDILNHSKTYFSIFKISWPTVAWHYSCKSIRMSKHKSNCHFIQPESYIIILSQNITIFIPSLKDVLKKIENLVFYLASQKVSIEAPPAPCPRWLSWLSTKTSALSEGMKPQPSPQFLFLKHKIYVDVSFHNSFRVTLLRISFCEAWHLKIKFFL